MGAISVPLNNAYTASELSYFLDDIKPSLVVCDPASPIIKESLLNARDKTSLLTLDKHGKGSLFERIENNSRSENIADVDENDIANVPEGGRGLPIMKTIMDNMTYKTVNGKNCLTMIKRRSNL